MLLSPTETESVLGGVAFYGKTNIVSCQIIHLDGYTAYVNGIPLDETSIIRISTTEAEHYLPQGTKEIRFFTHEVSNLISMPKVRVIDENGNAVGFDFTDERITDYCRYSDMLFSVRVTITLNRHRADGSVKESVIDQSLFFEKQASGKWLCYAMTAVDISQYAQQVRLTFKNEDKVLQSEFYDASAARIPCPVIDAPKGKQLLGWMTLQENEKRETVRTLIFRPDTNGIAIIPAGVSLEPMTLYPYFA